MLASCRMWPLGSSSRQAKVDLSASLSMCWVCAGKGLPVAVPGSSSASLCPCWVLRGNGLPVVVPGRHLQIFWLCVPTLGMHKKCLSGCGTQQAEAELWIILWLSLPMLVLQRKGTSGGDARQTGTDLQIFFWVSLPVLVMQRKGSSTGMGRASSGSLFLCWVCK